MHGSGLSYLGSDTFLSSRELVSTLYPATDPFFLAPINTTAYISIVIRFVCESLVSEGV